MAFPSVYEMFTPLTTVRKQHFWDYFSGATLNSRWTVNNHSYNGTATMLDAVDGGVRITGGTGTNYSCEINFNDRRPFAHDGSVFIGVCKPNLDYSTTNMFADIGFASPDYRDATDQSTFNIHTGQDYIRIKSGSTSANTNYIDTTVASSNTRHTLKLELNGTVTTPSIDGVLQTTKSNPPDTNLQPFAQAWRGNAGTAQLDVNYIEVYNT